MAVPYTFGSATTSIPLSQLDSNFATTITLGNTAIQLGNTVTTLNNMTLANVTISSGTSNLASTSISNGTSNVTVNSSGGNITLGTAGTTAVTIDTGQRSTFPTTIAIGGATPSTSGSGISFPATQSASSNANTLDDYEEGTWSPVFVPGSGSITTQSSSGRYTKIGNMVILTGSVTVANWGTAGGGVDVTGLPFSFADKFSANGVETVKNGKQCAGRWDTIGATQFSFNYYDNSGIANTGGNDANFNFSATYRT